MKLVITTQSYENYGAHDWDGTCECPQYWKPKGGDTYVVRDLTWEQVERIEAKGLPNLTSLIEIDDVYYREIIINSSITTDDDYECEPWESPVELSYNRIAECWTAVRTIHRDECWADGIDYKMEGWVLAPGGERKHYNSNYYGPSA